MKNEHNFDRIREDIEARQRNTVWPDTFRNSAIIDAFLWKGDPNAKPVQRIGLIILALFFLLLCLCLITVPFQENFEDGSSFVFFAALIPFLVAMRLLRNAFLRPPRHRKEGQSD
jgi:hypothetical protein